MTWLARTRALTRHEWWVVLEAAALTPVAAAAVRGLPLPRAVDLVHAVGRCRRSPPRVKPGSPSLALGRLSALVKWSASRLGARCLVQAIVLQAVLRRRGVRSDVVVGGAVGGSEGMPRRDLMAHAWVEHNGSVLMGAEAGTFVPICRLSGTAPASKALA